MKITEAVAQKIAASGENVQNSVIEKLANVEINRRIDLVVQAISKVETMKKDLNKINRNDSATYVDGVRVESMSEKRFKEIDSAKKNIEKLESAIGNALDINSEDAFKKLSDLLKGGNNQQAQAEEKAE